MDTVLIFSISFFLIALIYSSVGFGGGSSYLAMMAVMNVPMDTMRPSALLCNLVVVIGGTYIFGKAGHLDWRRSWPIIAVSIPFAFVGGYWKIGEHVFFILLGATLILASVALWIQPQADKEEQADNLPRNLGISAGVGLLSGLVSIGGGIFLSPILHLSRWGNAQKIAALASAFILGNSISGLAGQLLRRPEIDWKLVVPMLIAVFLGGQLGSRLGATWLKAIYIRRVTAALILFAGVNILKDHL